MQNLGSEFGQCGWHAIGNAQGANVSFNGHKILTELSPTLLAQTKNNCSYKLSLSIYKVALIEFLLTSKSK